MNEFLVNNCDLFVFQRIAYITSTLQRSLEESLLDGLRNGDTDVLQRCLRTYVIIDKINDAENLIRVQIVKTYMEQVRYNNKNIHLDQICIHGNFLNFVHKIITEENLQQHPDGLRTIYSQVLEFVPEHCTKIQQVLAGTATGSV